MKVPEGPREPESLDPGVSDAQVRAEQQAFAQEVLRAEAEAVGRIRITPAFHEAVDLILQKTARGRGGAVVVSGLGKSGLIAAKLSATFASTGTPSHFLHPTEAMHGDLGRVRHDDVVLMMSFGGNTEEVVSLATILKLDGVPVIAIVGRAESDLARLATALLCVGDIAEACPLNLAPTASTTAMLALGDALALAVSKRRCFSPQDFRRMHPGGLLGRQLTPVVDVLRFRAGENLPIIGRSTTLQEAFDQAERIAGGPRRPGAVLVADDEQHLVGIFTDGDLRRCLIRHGAEVMQRAVGELMTRDPRRLGPQSLVRDAVQMVREFRIDEIPVVDDECRILGLIDVQDLVALKVIEA